MASDTPIPLVNFLKIKPRSLKIEEPLEDDFVDEFAVAIFECKIKYKKEPTVNWYKDGKLVEESERFKLYKNNRYYGLKILKVDQDDIGTYAVVCKDELMTLYSKATLYVTQTRNLHINDGVLYDTPCDNEKITVYRHITDISLNIGERIELQVILKTCNRNQYFWYKSNKPIVDDSRTFIINGNNFSTLTIHHAQNTDSGLYHVVAKTNDGIVSSFATVVVTERNENKVTIPEIVEPFAEEFEANTHEELHITAKIQIDSYTVWQWMKDAAELSTNSDLKIEDYGNGYVGLRFLNPDSHNNGEYTLLLRHLLTGASDGATTAVNFCEPPSYAVPFAALTKQLDTVVACFGSKVLLKCSFDIKRGKYFYVVWYVGRFRIECTNHRFVVVCQGGDYFLIIKRLEADMAGVIRCELRYSLPNRKSVYVNHTSANMAIVPRPFFNLEVKNQSSFNRKICFNLEVEPSVRMMRRVPRYSAWRRYKQVNMTDIDFCRLDEDGFCFVEDISKNLDKYYNDLIVHVKDVKVPPSKHEQVTLIKWSPMRPNLWFIIEFMQENGIYYEAGTTTKPEFKITNAPIGRILKMRIRPVAAADQYTESTVCITASVEKPEVPPPSPSHVVCNVKTMEEFNAVFTKTDDTIGRGAFGTVILVKDKNEENFAAKIIKIRSQKKRDAALRESHLMLFAKNKLLVELKDVFLSSDACMLVMDYLWGGELFERIIEDPIIMEEDVIPYICQICDGLAYLHSANVAHLDIKPENIICLNPNSRQIKIIDLGLAHVLNENKVTRALYGTKDFMAPEVLSYDNLTFACDMWSLGVVTYMLLSGVMPFAGETWMQRSVSITMVRYNFDDTAFDNVSDAAKAFIKSLLLFNPGSRLSAQLARNHRWLIEGPPKGAKARPMKQTRENLKSYLANYRARWQKDCQELQENNQQDQQTCLHVSKIFCGCMRRHEPA